MPKREKDERVFGEITHKDAGGRNRGIERDGGGREIRFLEV